MKIKSKYKIGGLWYKVRIRPLEDEKVGYLESCTQSISVEKAMTPAMQEFTLFHEIIHAINAEINEEDTEFLAQMLYQVLTDNDMLK